MDLGFSKIKEELMDLFGTISVKEIISNQPLTMLIKEISKTLECVSHLDHYKTREGI